MPLGRGRPVWPQHERRNRHDRQDRCASQYAPRCPAREETRQPWPWSHVTRPGAARPALRLITEPVGRPLGIVVARPAGPAFRSGLVSALPIVFAAALRLL